MSDMDQRLKQALEEHTAGVRVVGDLAQRAIARDRANRRRELGTAVLGAGLALAVAVPLAWSSLRPAEVRPMPVGPSESTSLRSVPTAPPSTPPPTRASTTAPAPTAIPTLRPTDAPDAVTLASATGAPTASTDVGYVVDGVFHLGGTSIPLPEGLRSPYYVARLGDGLLLSGPDGWVVVGPDGRKGRVIGGAQQPPRVSADLQHVLLNDAGGTLIYADRTGRTLATLAPPSTAGSGYSAAGLVGTTAYAARPDTGASIAWDLVSGRVTPLEGELSSVNPVTGTGIAHLKTNARPDGSNFCHALVDLASGRAFWRLCAPLRLLGFSDDGQYLLGTGHVEGLAPWRFASLVVVRASDGAIVVQGDGSTSDAIYNVVGGARMSTDQHITFQAQNGDRRSLQRCTLDGRCVVVGAARSLPNPQKPEAAGPAYVVAEN